MLEKRAYGITCRECKYPIQIGFAFLRKGALLAELRDEVSAKGGPPNFERCLREGCSVGNQVVLEKLIFVDVKF
jgi:hypothetical protein